MSFFCELSVKFPRTPSQCVFKTTTTSSRYWVMTCMYNAQHQAEEEISSSIRGFWSYLSLSVCLKAGHSIWRRFWFSMQEDRSSSSRWSLQDSRQKLQRQMWTETLLYKSWNKVECITEEKNFRCFSVKNVTNVWGTIQKNVAVLFY